MSFFNSLLKAGTSALGALDDAATEGQLKLWDTLKRSDNRRILNEIKENGLSNGKSAIAVAAYFYNGGHATSLTVCVEDFSGSARENKDTIKRNVSRVENKFADKRGYKAEELYDALSVASKKVQYL